MPYLVQILDGQRTGDAIAITGTVTRTAGDGTALDTRTVRVRVWKSHLDTLSTADAKKTYVRRELKAAYQADEPAGQSALLDTAPVETT